MEMTAGKAILCKIYLQAANLQNIYYKKLFLCSRCLMPHCLGILKSAHLLTDNIVKHALIESRELPETLLDLVPLAKKIGIRVDEVVKSMYPPLDPRLLEARLINF